MTFIFTRFLSLNILKGEKYKLDRLYVILYYLKLMYLPKFFVKQEKI